MKKISFKNFLNIKVFRKQKIDEASNDVKNYKYKANEIAKILHPYAQYVVVSKVEDITPTMKRYTLSPNSNKGCIKLAPYASGQYISVRYDLGNIKTTRAYSLSSESNEDAYQITIKKVEDGVTSNYAFDHFKEGYELEISAPNGEFVYEPLRDEANIIGIAGGSGITPFLSFARAISKNNEDFNLTLLYGARNKSELAFKDEFDEIASKCDKFKVVYVLSDESNENYEHGFINETLIKKYMEEEKKYSFFVCGPKAMYEFAHNELDKLGVDKKHQRFEVIGEATSIKQFKDAPESYPSSVKITIHQQEETIVIDGTCEKTIMRNLEDANIPTLSKCRSGICGYCHSALISGSVFIPQQMNHLREADKIYNQIHICSAFPLSDIEIIVSKV